MLVLHLVEVTLSISHRQTPASLTPDTAGVCKLSIHEQNMPSTLENLMTKTLPEGESIAVKDRSVLVFKALSVL